MVSEYGIICNLHVKANYYSLHLYILYDCQNPEPMKKI